MSPVSFKSSEKRVLRRCWWAISAGVLLLAGMILTSAGCGRPGGDRADGRPVFAATIPPLAAVLRELAGDRAEIHCLLPPGASPHAFEPRPADVARVARSRGLFYVDDSLDGWAAQVPAPRRVVVFPHLPDSQRIVGSCTLHDHHSHDHHGEPYDAHFWTDPVIIGEMAGFLAARLAELDPDGAALYHANAVALESRMALFDRDLADRLAPLRGEQVVLFHPSLLYFLRRYGLEYAGAIEASPGKEATPQHLVHLRDTIRSRGVKALFTEPQLPPRPAQAVAEAAGVPLFVLDPLGGVEGRLTYEELMNYNAEVLLKALR